MNVLFDEKSYASDRKIDSNNAVVLYSRYKYLYYLRYRYFGIINERCDIRYN
jgi:hypothetical protein